MAVDEANYALSKLPALLGLSRAAITALVKAGFVKPERGPRREYRFSFQDVVLLRTAHGLQAAGVPPRRIARALKRLRERLPEHLPLTGLRIGTVGDQVAVWEGNAPLHAESGQWLIDFEVATAPGGVARLAIASEHHASDDAADWFARGCALEAQDAAAAEAAYREAIALAPDDTDAWLNLGCMLCEAGRCAEAAELLQRALAQHPGEALLHFNLAIALEDLGRDAAALAAYERCLELAPDLADAHYNAARLHEAAGRPARALRHYNAYRRLQR